MTRIVIATVAYGGGVATTAVAAASTGHTTVGQCSILPGGNGTSHISANSVGVWTVVVVVVVMAIQEIILDCCNHRRLLAFAVRCGTWPADIKSMSGKNQ